MKKTVHEENCSFEQSTNTRFAAERLNSAPLWQDWGSTAPATATTPIARTVTVMLAAVILVGCVPMGSTVVKSILQTAVGPQTIVALSNKRFYVFILGRVYCGTQHELVNY